MLTTQASAWPLIYFGKLPCRGDFIRSSNGQALIARLDPWFSQTLARLAHDVRWRLLWDDCPPVDFAVLGSRSPVGLLGQIRASQDASGRLFPFSMAAQFPTAQPMSWLGEGSLQLGPAWETLETLGQSLVRADSYESVQALMGRTHALEVPPADAACRAQWQALLEEHGLLDLELAMSSDGRQVDLRRCVIALGILLEPLREEGPQALAKGLRLPMPTAEPLRSQALAFWLRLLASQVQQHGVELALMLPRRAPQWLMLSFHGASTRALCAALHPDMAQEDMISLDEPLWVDDCLGEWRELLRWSTELEHPGLSLREVLRGFETVFGNDGR